MQKTKAYKEITQTNPIMVQRFGADPYAMEFNGRLYVYMTNDILAYENGVMINNNFRLINTINCVSSDDMVNWTDHGSMPIAGVNGAAKWATNSWAPAAAHKKINGKDKFFLYFADSGRGIGVVSSDTPIGPWVDPIDGPIVSQHSPNCADVLWCFDPAVLVDDDNRAYFYFGGGVPEGKESMPKTARVVELGDDMISIKGIPVMIDPPYLFEDSGINKIGDTYYYSYCSNFSERNDPNASIAPPAGYINYMTSKSPLGPFEYQKFILKNPGDFFEVGGNNHHCFIKFKGEFYMFWHTQTLATRLQLPAGGYRCVHVDRMTVNVDGSIEPIEASYNGVTAIKTFDPYQVNKTDTFAWEAGIDTVPDSKNELMMCLTGIDSGDYIGIANVDFTQVSPTSITVDTATVDSGCEIHIILDSLDNEAVAVVTLPVSEDITKTTVPISATTGVHNVFFVFEGKNFTFNAWQFNK